MNLLGIEIGGTKLQLVRGDECGIIRERRKLKVTAGSDAAAIRDQIAGVLPDLCTHDAVTAVGVGFGGPVDWRAGKICCSHQISGWSGFDLRGWLERLTGCPVFVDNDANIAALAEACCGAGVGCDPVFYVTLGSGVGGGLVVDRKIYHGAAPGEAEIGHVRLDRAGATVESRCSGWSLNERVRTRSNATPASPLAKLSMAAPGHEARHLAAALAQGDALAQELLQELCEDLAFGLSPVVHLLHPQVIVLGGGLAGIGEPLRAGVATALPRFVMTAFAPGPEVRLAGLGADVVTTGALLLAGSRLDGE